MKVMSRTTLFVALTLVGAVSNIYSLEFVYGAEGAASTETNTPVYGTLEAGMNHSDKGFTFEWLLTGDTAGEYSTPFHGDYFGDFNVDIKKAGITYQNDTFRLALGKLPGKDIVQSPYSLYLNPAQDPMLSIDFTYDGDLLYFNERWMGLNYDSAYGWKDRGAVVKSYAIVLGHFRFGFQDVLVSSSSYLNPLDLLIPAPSFLVQYVNTAQGRPWSADPSTSNENTIMGFFSDFTGENWYVYGQCLVDDFSANRFFKPNEFQDQDKIALSAGGSVILENKITLGFYAALATKYTFQSFGSYDSGGAAYDTQYGYSRWPVNAIYVNGKWQLISVDKNMIGYCNGENNVSFMLTTGFAPFIWVTDPPPLLRPLTVSASLEFSITGEQSPGNPWNDKETKTELAQGMHLLDDPVLNKKICAEIDSVLPVGPFSFSLGLTCGYEWNKMCLNVDAVTVKADDTVNGQPWFVPGSINGIIASFKLGVVFTHRY